MSYIHVLDMNPNSDRRVEMAKYQTEKRKANAKIMNIGYRLVKKAGMVTAIVFAVKNMEGLKRLAFDLACEGAWGRVCNFFS